MRFSLLAIGLAMALLMPSLTEAQSCDKAFRHLEVYAGLGLFPTFLQDQVQGIQPPLFVGARYRFNDRLSLGMLVGQSAAKVTRRLWQGLEQTLENRFSVVAIRGAAHTHRWEKWEVYGGMSLGYAFNDAHYAYELTDTRDQALGEILQPRWRDGIFLSAFLGTSFSPYPRCHLFA